MNVEEIMQAENAKNSIERGWHSLRFKDEFDRVGINASQFCRLFDFQRNAVSISIKKPYPKVDRLLAELFNAPLAEIWPNRYFWNGVRITSAYNVEKLTNDELQRLNEGFGPMNPLAAAAIRRQYPPLDVQLRLAVERHAKEPNDVVEKILNGEIPRFANVTKVQLPPGVIIDGK